MHEQGVVKNNNNHKVSWIQLVITLVTLLVGFAFAYGLLRNEVYYHETEITNLKGMVRQVESSYVDKETLRQATADMKEHFDEKLLAQQKMIEVSLGRIEDKIDRESK